MLPLCEKKSVLVSPARLLYPLLPLPVMTTAASAASSEKSGREKKLDHILQVSTELDLDPIQDVELYQPF